jgi:glycosyltransferase involved in cell wall biosynthesis
MNRTLGYVTPVRAYRSAGEIYMQAASGKVADALAAQYARVYMCSRVVEGPPDSPAELPLEAGNIELISQPFWKTSAGSLPHFFGIARAYIRTCRRADVLFVRGMCPYIGVLYLCAFFFRRPICHWIVGDPVALLRTGRRKGLLTDALAWLYALQDRAVSRLGRWLTGGAFVCNGDELARAFSSPRTIATVSSTVQESDFSPRLDSCRGPRVRILFVGYIRPEKGIEYLLDAVAQLRYDGSWELEIVGPDQFPQYRRKLDEIVAAHKLQDRVKWTGYVPFGPPLFDRMRAADIFVLPTLSEGTPHVLVEARATGLPCISTAVGGVPTVVTHGMDALLVPPKNSRALARAMQRIIRDGDLRRALIRNGLASARLQTLGHFTGLVFRELEAKAGRNAPAMAQEAGPRA